MSSKIKVEVTKEYLDTILQVLEEAKIECATYKFKNTLNKHINKTKYYIKK